MKKSSLIFAAFAMLWAGAPLRADPVYQDIMEDAGGFSQPHGVLEIDDAEAGRVILWKTGFEDGFVWLRGRDGRAFPNQEDHQRLEIDVAELLGGTLELRIGLNDSSGNFIGGFVWEPDVREPGTVILENVGARIEEAGQPGAASFLVMLRIKGDSGSTAVIEEFRLSPVKAE